MAWSVVKKKKRNPGANRHKDDRRKKTTTRGDKWAKTPLDQRRTPGKQYDKERAGSAKNFQNCSNQSENMIRPPKEKDVPLLLTTDNQPPGNQEIPET